MIHTCSSQIVLNTDMFESKKTMLYVWILLQDTAIQIPEIQLHVFHLTTIHFFMCMKIDLDCSRAPPIQNHHVQLCSWSTFFSPQMTCHCQFTAVINYASHTHDLNLFSGCDTVLGQVSCERLRQRFSCRSFSVDQFQKHYEKCNFTSGDS